MTQLERARSGVITEEIIEVSEDESIYPEFLKEYVATGKVVIPSNKNRRARIIGIGKGLRTKVNASIGTSTDIVDIEGRHRKWMFYVWQVLCK